MEDETNFVLELVTIVAIMIGLIQEGIAWSKCNSNSIGQLIHNGFRKCYKKNVNATLHLCPVCESRWRATPEIELEDVVNQTV